MSDLISRQAAIDAMCLACGHDCDKSKFVYDAPQDEQVIMCPEHYALSTLPSADRPTGKWELIESEHVENIYLCTHCRNYEAWGETEKTPYCPQCGSHNGGGQSEND
jgi:hypothetical protein